MKNTNARWVLALSLFAASAVTPFAALAQSNGTSAQADPAKAHLDRGSMFYDLQDWAAAQREFKEAYMADPKPQTLFMLGQAQRLGGDWATAIGSYKAYARLPGVTPTQQAAAEALIHKCEAEIEAKKNAPAAAATTPTPTPAAPPATVPPPKEKPSGPGPWYGDVLGGVLFFGGLAVAGTGTAFLVVGNSAMSRSSSASSYAAYQDQSSSAKPEQTLGVVGIGVGAALFVGGVLRYVLVAGKKPQESGVALMLAPAVGPGFATAMLSGRF
jgi:hypothetical protein